jgi:serine/threonine-protein kinase
MFPLGLAVVRKARAAVVVHMREKPLQPILPGLSRSRKDAQGGMGMGEERRQRYLRAKPIVLAALDMAVVERECYVASACCGDDALLDEVRWMLEAAEVTVGRSGLPGLAELPDDTGAVVSAAGCTGYRILHRLGEGGGGVVYLAERTLDEGTPGELRQRVALKFLHAADRPGSGTLLRFAEERRILATLNHPNIAHLIDGGTTRDGRPFLALEYVEGERIDHWCERQQLPLRERVALFLKVCAAVHYAHQHLVIHRDIKPANILVTPDGEPKLLDFGIARLLDHVGGVAAAQTQTAQRALTLAYASPEQLRGQPLGTGADVWSLGVVLYQLVCGVRPFGDSEGDSPLTLSQAIVTGRLLPPSRRLRRLGKASPRPAVPADIDAIVMKALRREPAERYPSVDALAADLRRFLAARPVRARQGQRWYHARLFVRRHRLGLGAAAVLVAVLVGLAVEREAQLQRVEIARDRTQAIAGFLQDLFENADPTHAQGSHLTVREVLDRGAGQLMARKDVAAPVRVSLLLSMARSYNQLSLGGKAIPLLLEARRLQGGYDADALERGEVLAALGRAYSMVIDLPSAIPVDRQAIALLSQAPGDHAEAILRVRINQLYNHLGVLDVPLARIDRQIRQVVAQLEAQPRSEPELHVQALAVLAMTEAAEGDDHAGVATARRALDEAERLYVADDPMRVYYRFTLALVSMRVDPAGAVAQFRRAIDDYDRMVGTPGPGLAGLLSYFGSALGQAGQPAAAAQALQRAADIAKGFAAQSPDFYLGTLDSLAWQYIELGRDTDAEAVLAPHRPLMAERAATGSAWAVANAADALNVLGTVALHRGRTDEARRDFQLAQAQMGARDRQVSPDTWAASLAGLGEAALTSGQLDEATRQLAMLDTFNRASRAPPDGWPALDAALLRGRLDLARGRYGQVAELVAAALPLAAARGGACSPRSVALRRLALDADARGRAGTATLAPACTPASSVAALMESP